MSGKSKQDGNISTIRRTVRFKEAPLLDGNAFSPRRMPHTGMPAKAQLAAIGERGGALSARLA